MELATTTHIVVWRGNISWGQSFVLFSQSMVNEVSTNGHCSENISELVFVNLDYCKLHF